MDIESSLDPATRGTSEEEWRAMLRHSRVWSPKPGSLLVVASHPDDEVLGAGGLVSSWAVTGQRVSVISVTDGEAADVSRRDVSIVKRSELRNALRKLSWLHVDIHRLAIPDGRVSAYTNRLRRFLLDRIEPELTLIAPYELDGYPDHNAVGQVCLDVAQITGVTIARYPIWAWNHATPRAFRSLRWGLFRLASAAQRAKSRAIQCFYSQLRSPIGMPFVLDMASELPHLARPYEAFLV